MREQFDLFNPPTLQRTAPVPSGAVFLYGGRPLRIYKTYGEGLDAPVIVEELSAFGSTLKGQFAIWSADAVARCLAGGLK